MSPPPPAEFLQGSYSDDTPHRVEVESGSGSGEHAGSSEPRTHANSEATDPQPPNFTVQGATGFDHTMPSTSVVGTAAQHTGITTPGTPPPHNCTGSQTKHKQLQEEQRQRDVASGARLRVPTDKPGAA